MYNELYIDLKKAQNILTCVTFLILVKKNNHERSNYVFREKKLLQK